MKIHWPSQHPLLFHTSSRLFGKQNDTSRGLFPRRAGGRTDAQNRDADRMLKKVRSRTPIIAKRVVPAPTQTIRPPIENPGFDQFQKDVYLKNLNRQYTNLRNEAPIDDSKPTIGPNVVNDPKLLPTEPPKGTENKLGRAKNSAKTQFRTLFSRVRAYWSMGLTWIRWFLNSLPVVLLRAMAYLFWGFDSCVWSLDKDALVDALVLSASAATIWTVAIFLLWGYISSHLVDHWRGRTLQHTTQMWAFIRSRPFLNRRPILNWYLWIREHHAHRIISRLAPRSIAPLNRTINRITRNFFRNFLLNIFRQTNR